MYTEDGKGNVILTMAREDFYLLLITLGYATGAVSRQGGEVLTFNQLVAFTNRLNEGNPRYTPYNVGEGEPQKQVAE